MSSEEIVLSVKNLSKLYEIYDKPGDRLKQFIFPKIARLFGRAPKKYYREFAALNNVSFDIKKGETVGIIGRNGSGKSTLLQIICRTLASTTGLVESKGRIAALLELGSGFNPEFTGRENVRLSAMIMGLSAKQVEEKMTQILEFADIGEFIDQPVRTYSSGMFMRLAFAVQAHIDPEILIVDEALAVGDTFFTHKCMSRFHELKRNGITIILVTHDSTAIKTLCDKAIWLKDGRLLGYDNSALTVDRYLSDTTCEVALDLNRNSQLSATRSEKLSMPRPTERRGDGKISIIGAEIKINGISVEEVSANEQLSIVLSIKNLDLYDPCDLIVGYILKNSRGIDLASNNNKMEGVKIDAPSIGEEFILEMNLVLPLLHVGEYVFSITLAYLNKAHKLNVLDHCENLLRFRFNPKKECHVLMTINTNYVCKYLS